jgi:hypothetical protein
MLKRYGIPIAAGSRFRQRIQQPTAHNMSCNSCKAAVLVVDDYNLMRGEHVP